MAEYWRRAGFTLAGLLQVLAGCGLNGAAAPDHQDSIMGPAEDSEAAALPGQATLVGMAEDREAHERDSSLRGRILRLDGRTLNRTKEEHVDAGCHLVEAEVEYEITRLSDEPCIAFKAFGACDRVAKFESGRRHFAIPMKPGMRYELSARIDENGPWVYFVEVDAELGTVARFAPVPPGTTACAPGVAL